MSKTEEALEISVDATKCLAYGTCVSIAPDFFDLPKGAKTVIALKRIAAPEELEELEEAVRNCPVRALKLAAIVG